MDIEKLHERIEKSKKLLEKSCDERTDAIRQFVGKHYGNNASSKVVPTNLLEMAVTIYLRLLAAKAPRCDVKTENPSLEPFANDVEIVINQIPGEIGLADTIEEVVREAMFSLGVVKVGIADASDDPKRGDEPFVSLVQLDDYFVDMSAKSWREIQYEGNEYWMDTEAIKSFYGVDISGEDYNGTSTAGVEQAKAIELNESADPLFERVLLRDVYIPKTGEMITYAVQGKKVLRTVKWDGPLGTPYVKLAFSGVPGNLMPLPPVAVLEDLHELANTIFRKIANQAIAKKTVVAIQGGTDEEVSNFKHASDGDAIKLNGLRSESLVSGGVDTQLLATFIQIRDLYSVFGGNLDALGGLSPQSETAAQDKLISEAASARVKAMADKVEKFASEIFKRLAWYTWTDPVRVRKYVKWGSRKYGIYLNKEWTPETRDGDFLDYNFSVSAMSMQEDTPSVRLQKLTNIFQTFMPILMPVLEQQGIMIDAERIFSYIGKNANMPELPQFFISGNPPQDQQPAAAGASRPEYVSTKAPVTHRTYERVNRPAGTRQGRDAAMMQVLLGGNPQAAEKAGLAAGRSIA